MAASRAESDTVANLDVIDNASSSDDDTPVAREYTLSATPTSRGQITGELLKQSFNTADIWRRRLCVVVSDKLWCLKPPGPAPWVRRRSTLISLAHSHAAVQATSHAKYGFELQTPERVWRFAAASREEQSSWVRLLNDHARYASDNDLIRIADHIICDEQRAHYRRRQHEVEEMVVAATKERPPPKARRSIKVS